MKTFQLETPIAAPPERVFEIISDAARFCEAVPGITEVEILSPQQRGLGTRFREKRRRAATELEVTGYEEGHMIRLESTAGGAVWDSVFTVERDDEGGSVLLLEMKAYSQTFLSNLTMPFLGPTIRRTIRKDMNAVKAYCEGGPSGESGEEPVEGSGAS